MEDRINKLEEEIILLKNRNKKVEANKAWEISRIRTFLILVLTYMFASTALFVIGANNFLLGAIIPTLGYFLSMQSLPFIKRWWIENYIK